MRATDVNPFRHARARVPPRPPRPPPAPRELAARRALDRLLVLAIAASLIAAVFERRAREELGSAPIPSFPVDLARDPPERLRLLPGLGQTRVTALLGERARAGPPSTWADLERVRGIGAKTLEGWRTSGATVGPPPAEPAAPDAPVVESSALGRSPNANAPPDPPAPLGAGPPSIARPPPTSRPQAESQRREGGGPPEPHAR